MNRTGRIQQTLLALGLVALVGAGCKKTEEAANGGGGHQAPPVMITTGQVSRGTITEYASLAGHVRWPQRAILRAELEGPVRLLALREGETFQKGDVLVELDLRDYQLVHDRAVADLERAKKQLALLQVGTRAEAIERLRAQSSETVAQAAEIDGQVREITAQAAELEAAAKLAEQQLARTQALFAQDVRTQADLDAAVAANAQAQARSGQTAARLAQMQAKLDQAKARQAQVQASLKEAENGPIAEDIAVSEANVAALQVAVNAAERDLQKARIVAPFDGVVLSTNVELGGYVRPGDPVLEIASNAGLEVLVDAPEELITTMQPGVTFDAKADALPDQPLTCTVIAIIPVADAQTRNFRLRASVSGGEGKLMEGMFIRTRVPIASATDALLVPLDAVVLAPNSAIVWTVHAAAAPGAPGTATPTSVTLGLQAGDLAQIITDALRSGDTVVTTGGEMLAMDREGNPPHVIDAAAMRGGGPPGGAPGGGEKPPATDDASSDSAAP